TENSSDIKLEYGYLKNCTNSSKDKILSTANQKPKFKISKNSQPQVLIMHSHTTESFLMSKTDTYIKDQSFRTTDNNKNISSVGKIIAQELKQAGISVIHDTTQHDYPAYPGSYERSRETVMRILKEYPSIKIVLDIHRDAIVPDNNSIIAPVCTINGEKYAQVMIISGYDDGTMNMPKCMENLKLACLIQSQMEKDYPTLTRPILFDYRKYNQDLTTGSLLIEVGGHGNTLQEVQNSGKLIGKSISKALFSY
ncbi:MAG: stage II sporulation protein P, partial [Oscillospiraceae bacterium]